MLTLNSPQVVQETTLRWKRDSKIALVPTMGCLHEGHLSLIDKAREHADRVVVSIFVNPLQFGQGEDFERYPRPIEQDIEKLEARNVDLLFNPGAKELYPEGFSTRVNVSGLTSHLCGISRPGHFEGVATVCLKLFSITQADFAVFGKKDFQQLAVIRRMTADLNLPLTIIPHDTVREADGLAMSSRNRMLSPEERKRALKIPLAIERVQALGTNVSVGEILSVAVKTLAEGDLSIDYVTVASARDLVPATESVKLSEILSPHFFIAAKSGTTRLIDNAPLGGGAA